MKGIVTVAFVIFLSLLTVSCASAPHWSGAETEAGEFIWRQTPGIRFYFNVLILVALLFSFVLAVFKKPKKSEKKDDLGLEHIGCLALIAVLIVIVLWGNIKQNIRRESILINSERIVKNFYRDSTPVNQTLEWKNVVSCVYFSGQFGVVNHRMTVGRTEWQTGENRRGITLSDQNKMQITLVVEKDEFDTHWMKFFNEWIFGSNDLAFSFEDEARLKKALNKYLPENVKKAMSPETIEYLSDGK